MAIQTKTIEVKGSLITILQEVDGDLGICLQSRF